MKIKEVRTSKGLSQKQLAEAAEISLRVLQAYEQGARDINGAKIKTLIKLAEALNCKIVDILEDEELIHMINNTYAL